MEEIPVIIFYNPKTKRGISFDKETKEFRTEWKLNNKQVQEYENTENLGRKKS